MLCKPRNEIPALDSWFRPPSSNLIPSSILVGVGIGTNIRTNTIVVLSFGGSLDLYRLF
jgi:hypothetical protein